MDVDGWLLFEVVSYRKPHEKDSSADTHLRNRQGRQAFGI